VLALWFLFTLSAVQGRTYIVFNNLHHQIIDVFFTRQRIVTALFVSFVLREQRMIEGPSSFIFIVERKRVREINPSMPTMRAALDQF